jgi:hypothetical protein
MRLTMSSATMFVFATACMIALIGRAPVTGTPASNDTLERRVALNGAVALSDPDVRRLRRIGGWVFYPSYVPARFSRVSVTTSVAKHPRDRYYQTPPMDYDITYCDAASLCFAVSSACEGIGDVVGYKRSLKARSPLFGPIEIFADDVRRFYITEWLEDANMRTARDRGAGCPVNGGRYHHVLGPGISDDEEAVKIVESLRRLR